MGKKLAQTKPDRTAQSRGDGGEGKTNLFTKSILTGDVAPNMRWRGKGRVVYQTGREGNGRPGGGSRVTSTWDCAGCTAADCRRRRSPLSMGQSMRFSCMEKGAAEDWGRESRHTTGTVVMAG